LAPTDFSAHANQAVTATFALAQTFGAKLTVLHVVEPPSYLVDSHASAHHGTLVLKALEEQATRELDHLLSPIPDAQVEVTCRVMVGVPYQQIMAYASAEPVDLIVMATHGRTGLRHLVLGAAEFLYETRLFPEIEYTFNHALTQQVAYETLLQERRRLLHARIVAVLEQHHADRLAEQVERLAHHALRGEVWAKAVTYCRQAGEKAIARSAHREAVGSFEQALGALAHLPERRDTREQAIDLRLALRAALGPSSDFGRILAYLREAAALAAALDDPRRLAQVSLLLAEQFRLTGAYDQAIAAARPVLVLATAGGEVVLHALANRDLGLAYQAQGEYRRAIDCLGQTVASLEGARRHEFFGRVFLPAVLSRAYLAWCHAELGTFAEGKALGDEGLQIAEEVAHPGSLMYAHHGIGLLALRQGDLAEAVPRLERAMGLCQDTDLPLVFPFIAAALGAAYALAGRVTEALPLLTQAIEQARTLETADYQVLCHLSLGEAQVLAGQPQEAQAIAERALTLACERQERGHQAYALRLLGEIASRREPLERESAEPYYRQALALAEALGMRPLQAHCHRGLGTLYAETGRRELAHAELSTAIALYRAKAMTFLLPQVEAGLAQVEER
jgi:tetratricopeptide (TPR) repeat protein/nucleotide-binding universal stress UspA family protein